MNWIGTWCAQRCDIGNDCDKCSETCIPRIRIANVVNCSEHLVWILMNQDGGVTHPNIANAIADYVGATAEERDGIVHPKHRGTWKPDEKHKGKKRDRKWLNAHNALAVVAVDRLGHVIKSFPSIKATARYVHCSATTIFNRCNYVPLEKDEFEPLGITFRFEADWERLTPEQRVNDIKKRSMQI